MTLTSYELTPGERLRVTRERLGKSQAEMADSLGISTRGYQYYERGERRLPVKVLDTVHALFGVRQAWILDGVGTPFITGSAPEATAAPPAPTQQLSADEQRLIKRYRSLDEEGQAAVAALLRAMTSTQGGD